MSDEAKHRGTGRHRAPDPVTDPANLCTFDQLIAGTQPEPEPGKPEKHRHRGEKQPTHHMRNAAITAGAATSAIAIAWAMSNASPRTDTVEQVTARADTTTSQPSVQTANIEIVAPDSPKVSTVAAPPPPPPEPAPVAAPVTPEPVAVAAPAPSPAPIVVEQAAPAPVAQVIPVADKGADARAAIVAAAYAQIGMQQDCVAMVARALRNGIGVDWYKWPVEYYQIGYAVSASQALPGDLIYYVDGAGTSLTGWAHIAVYVGNGMAVHGGFNGNQTILFSANVGSGPNYIRVT